MTSKRRIEITWGVAIGLATIGWILIEYVIANVLGRPDLGTYTGFFAVIIPIVGIWLGLSRKKSANKGTLQYKDAILSGLMIAAVAAIINGVFMFFYLTAFPSVTDTYFAYVEETLIAQGEDPVGVQAALATLRNQFSPFNQAIQMFIGTFVAGGILSLLIGLFVRSKNVKPTVS